MQSVDFAIELAVGMEVVCIRLDVLRLRKAEADLCRCIVPLVHGTQPSNVCGERALRQIWIDSRDANFGFWNQLELQALVILVQHDNFVRGNKCVVACQSITESTNSGAR